MGMFTWLCKGCGVEIIDGELAIINGCRGRYDGYGGCGRFRFHYVEGVKQDLICWHQNCYDETDSKNQGDMEPSQRSPNQGLCEPNPYQMKLNRLKIIADYDSKDLMVAIRRTFTRENECSCKSAVFNVARTLHLKKVTPEVRETLRWALHEAMLRRIITREGDTFRWYHSSIRDYPIKWLIRFLQRVISAVDWGSDEYRCPDEDDVIYFSAYCLGFPNVHNPDGDTLWVCKQRILGPFPYDRVEIWLRMELAIRCALRRGDLRKDEAGSLNVPRRGTRSSPRIALMGWAGDHGA